MLDLKPTSRAVWLTVEWLPDGTRRLVQFKQLVKHSARKGPYRVARTVTIVDVPDDARMLPSGLMTSRPHHKRVLVPITEES